MYFNRRLLVVIALTALLAAAGIKWWWSAVSVEQTLSTPHLIVGVVGDPAGLNDLCPDGAVDRVRYLPQSAVYESPVSYDSTRGIRPLLLSDWRVASDARSVDLVFKKNVRFHNGKEMSALTVKQCWETTLSRAANTETAGLFSVIAGSQSYLKGETQDIPGLQVVSSYVLRVKFVSPQSYFISSLAHPAFWVYDSTDKATFAPGTGPFSIQEVKDNLVRVDAFTRYHDDGPQISGIEFQVFSDSDQALTAYQEGKLSLLDAVQPAQVKALGKDEAITRQLIRQPLLAVYGVAFNLDKEPWHNNYLLRRALNYAIDRQAIVRDIFAGGALSCVGPLPTGLKPAKPAVAGMITTRSWRGNCCGKQAIRMGMGSPASPSIIFPTAAIVSWPSAWPSS